MDTLQTVIQLVGEHFETQTDEITSETQFSVLDADSLDLVDLINEIEGEFGISVEDEDVDGISTVADVVRLVEEYLAKS